MKPGRRHLFGGHSKGANLALCSAALAADGSHTMAVIAAKGPAGFENVLVHMIGMEPSSRNILWKLPLTLSSAVSPSASGIGS